MSDNWDDVTHIGQKRGGASGGNRETRVKGKAALNAAFRTGGVTTQKKEFATANSKANQQGQRLTKVANSDDIMKPINQPKSKAESLTVKKFMEDARKVKKLKQEDLARLCNTSAKVIQDFEAGRERPKQEVVGNIEKHLGIWLNENRLGQPKTFGPKKGKEAAAKVEKEKK